MTKQEFTNMQRKVRKQFTPDEASVIESLLQHIRNIEEINRRDKIKIALLEKKVELLKQNSDLKISVLTNRLILAGVDISPESLLTVFHKSETEEETTNEG